MNSRFLDLHLELKKAKMGKNMLLAVPIMSVRFLNFMTISLKVLNTMNLKELLKSQRHSLGLKKRGYGQASRQTFVSPLLMKNIGLHLEKNT